MIAIYQILTRFLLKVLIWRSKYIDQWLTISYCKPRKPQHTENEL